MPRTAAIRGGFELLRLVIVLIGGEQLRLLELLNAPHIRDVVVHASLTIRHGARTLRPLPSARDGRVA